MKNQTQLLMQLLSVESKLEKRLARALSVHGIGVSEYVVMHALSESTHGAMQRTELAERVGLTPSGVTRLLIPMEKMGLVSKADNPRDARVSLVKMSETGARIYADACVTFDHSATALLKQCTASQSAQLKETLTALDRALVSV